MGNNSIIEINLIGDIAELIDGLEQIQSTYGFILSSSGVNVNVKKSNCMKAEGNIIYYSEKIEFFRLFIKMIKALKDKTDISVTEQKQFEKACVMVDMSRNAVMNIDSVKKWLIYMAGFGLNSLMLYTEDTYVVKEHPYMGYLRGRYNQKELKEIDVFAENLGIEVIPCIQTLGHLARYLRWDNSIRDTSDILLIDDEKSYEYIENCIKSISESLSSKYIHVGMDEATQIGLGRYLSEHGFCYKVEIFTRHLNKVKKICEKYNKKPIIWSDMYFKLGSKTGNYYDLDSCLTEEEINNIPKVDMVYWDYYTVNYDRYDKIIKSHKNITDGLWFAGACWTWGLFTHWYSKTKATAEVAVKACKKNNIKNLIITLWGDNGAQCPYFSALNGLALWGELVYSSSTDNVEKAFETVVSENIEYFNYFEKLDSPEILPMQDFKVEDQIASCMSLTLLWQDILLGLFDKDYKDIDFTTYYKKCYEKMDAFKSNSFCELFDFYKALAKALSIKGDIGKRLISAYKRSGLDELMNILQNDLPLLKQYILDLKCAHRLVWNKYNKPFGFEVIDIRYGGVISRIDSASLTIEEYLNGEIDMIAELEEERLPYIHDYVENTTSFVCDYFYNSIATTSEI